MDVLLLAVIGVLVVVAVTAVASRIGIAAPLLLVAVGVLASFVPGVPRVVLSPEVILAGILPPLLYASSVNMPTMDFRRDLRSIGGLSVGLVLASACLMGWLLPYVVPGIGFAEAFALGAIVSPTDAVATSMVRRTGVAPRLVTVLKGESMLNDATALVLLRTAIAAMAVSVSLWDVVGGFLQAVAVAAVVGVVVAVASLLVRALVDDATVATAVSFVVPFLAYRTRAVTAASRPQTEGEWAGAEGAECERRLEDYRALRRAVLDDQREALLEVRRDGTHDSAVLGAALARLDAIDVSVSREPRRTRESGDLGPT